MDTRVRVGERRREEKEINFRTSRVVHLRLDQQVIVCVTSSINVGKIGGQIGMR